jgi:hypothetical protein
MAVFDINKGIGKPVEFQGLQAQYIWYLFGGLVGNFMVFAVLYLIGLPPVLSVLYFLSSSSLLSFYVFRSGKKYGQHGLMMLRAKRIQPRYLVVRNASFFKNLRQRK